MEQSLDTPLKNEDLSNPGSVPSAIRTSQVNVGKRERLVSAVTGAALFAMAGPRPRLTALPIHALAASLLVRGLSGHCSLYGALGISSCHGHHPSGGAFNLPVKVQKTVTIQSTPEDLYSFWRNLENLPRFMEHLVSVEDLGEGRSNWVAKAPVGGTVSWEAEIEEDTANERISWRSLPGSDVKNNGSVTFHRAPGGRGTELRVVIRYEAPGGRLGQIIGKLLGEEPGRQLDADLRNLKAILEAGEIPRTDGQPSGSVRSLKSLVGLTP